MQESSPVVDKDVTVDKIEKKENDIIEIRIPFGEGEIIVNTTKARVFEAYRNAAQKFAEIQAGVNLPDELKAPDMELRDSFKGSAGRYFGRRNFNGRIEINSGRIADFVREPDKSISVDMGRGRPPDTDTSVLLFKRLLNIIFLHEVRHDLEVYESLASSWKKTGESINATLLNLLGSKSAL